MKNIWIALLPIIILLIGVIGLQIFLSTRKNRWLGLLIPSICLIYSIISVLSIVAFNSHVTTYAEDGTVIKETRTDAGNERPLDKGNRIGSGIIIFFISNIPTIIYLAIYYGCRERCKKNQQLKNMQIQDLE